MKQLISFVKSGTYGLEDDPHFWDDIYYGLFLVFLFAANELSETYFGCYKEILTTTEGVKAKNLIRSVIFEKFQTISESTNKEFAEGQLLNLMSGDASKAESMFTMLENLSRLPV
jgi:ABC-type multidrug transport system fused ATPase/permease subunit